jgi:hypothetical protein
LMIRICLKDNSVAARVAVLVLRLVDRVRLVLPDFVVTWFDKEKNRIKSKLSSAGNHCFALFFCHRYILTRFSSIKYWWMNYCFATYSDLSIW